MKKKLLAVLLASSLALSAAACGSQETNVTPSTVTSRTIASVPIRQPQLEEELLEKAAAQMAEGTDFSEISYTRYDDSDLQELIALIREKMTDASQAAQVADLFEQAIDSEYELWLSYTLADLYGALDVTSDYYAEESSYTTELLYTIDDQMDSLGKEILGSACGDGIREIWDPEDVDYYLEYEEMTAEQLELVTREEELENEYEKLSAQEFTVTLNGKTYTLEELYADDDLTDEEYYQGYYGLMENENQVLGPVYLELLETRRALANAYGYESYTDYAYEKVYDRDYSPADAAALSEAVKSGFLAALYAVYSGYNSRVAASLDEAFGQLTVEDHLSLFQSYLPQIDEDLLTTELYMETYHLYDLDYSATKLDAGFTTWLSNYEEPFLFHQKGGSFYDFTTLVHEFGHFNSYYQNPDTAATTQSIDLAEIHSQGLELLFTNLYPDMLGNVCGSTASSYTLIQIMSAVIDGCMYDEFQQAVYALEDPTLEEINTLFCQVSGDYGYTHYGSKQAYEWVYVTHNFIQPFYYISYAVSALPALEIWMISQTDSQKAIDLYLDLVALGESGGYQETLKACGLNNPFSGNYIATIAENISEYMNSN